MSGPPPSRARRRRFALALLALAPALLGCQQIGRGLERAVHAFVYVVSASVAVLALVVAALALDRLRRTPPTAERPRWTFVLVAKSAVTSKDFELNVYKTRCQRTCS